MEGIHRNLLSSVRRRKYEVVNFTIRATDPSFPLHTDWIGAQLLITQRTDVYPTQRGSRHIDGDELVGIIVSRC